MADVWPVQRRVLVVPQEEGSVVVTIQQRVFLQPGADSVMGALDYWNLCVLCVNTLAILERCERQWPHDQQGGSLTV